MWPHSRYSVSQACPKTCAPRRSASPNKCTAMGTKPILYHKSSPQTKCIERNHRCKPRDTPKFNLAFLPSALKNCMLNVLGIQIYKHRQEIQILHLCTVLNSSTNIHNYTKVFHCAAPQCASSTPEIFRKIFHIKFRLSSYNSHLIKGISSIAKTKACVVGINFPYAP